MVYYYTSGNVKMFKNLLSDYKCAYDISPEEYMKMYIEKCPETVDDTKLAWITETFLGIQKHKQFLIKVASCVCEELTEEDQEYFVIIFYAVSFQIHPKEMDLLYKCLFNLSKSLLSTFTKFLSNNESLTYLSHVAQDYYDANFVTEKIISPLFVWQPYIGEMGHTFGEYLKKIERRKFKQPTVPVQPNVLNRKGRETVTSQILTVPIAPPNSLRNRKRMLTKSAIDLKLKDVHAKNRQKAAYLLNDVKNNNLGYTKIKNYSKNVRNYNQTEKTEKSTKPHKKPKPKIFLKYPEIPIKETTATVKRMNRRMEVEEREQLEWLDDLVNNFSNNVKFEEFEELERQKKERERLLDIEKKHLLGQLSYEEAILSRKKLQEENKKKHVEFLKEKELWNDQIESWKKMQSEKNRKQIEKLSLIELNLINVKNTVALKKKEAVENLKKESEIMRAAALKEKNDELERRIKMINEIKILAMVAKKARVPKILDLTETSGLGYLCEMSMAELQERLAAMKVGITEELERKKKMIREDNLAAKQEIESTKNKIKRYMHERTMIKKENIKKNINENFLPSEEINELKKLLEEKRKLRMQMS